MSLISLPYTVRESKRKMEKTRKEQCLSKKFIYYLERRNVIEEFQIFEYKILINKIEIN